jgi:N-acetylglucosamine-6-phosphate deacetylase
VIVEDGVAKLPDRSSFAGSVATSNQLVKVMWKDACIPLTDVICMMSATPARIAGVDSAKGSLEPGKDADIVLFDDDVNIIRTYVKGKEIQAPSNYRSCILAD